MERGVDIKRGELECEVHRCSCWWHLHRDEKQVGTAHAGEKRSTGKVPHPCVLCYPICGCGFPLPLDLNTICILCLPYLHILF